MKHYTQGAKRRNKKALPELEPVPKKYASGNRKEPESQDPRRTSLEARARQMGMPLKVWREMSDTAYGEGAGMAIYSIHRGAGAKDLWDTYRTLSAAYERFMRERVGLSVHAKTAKIEMMPERFEVDASLHHDDRTDDERHRAAINKWAEWNDALNKLPLGHRSTIFSALHGWATLMDAGHVTLAGKRFVMALEVLEERA